MILRPPPSKSDALRRLVVAHAAGLPLPAVGPDDPEDIVVTARGLAALAAAGRPINIDARDGGAPLRFLLAQAAILPGAQVTFTGSVRLGERPHGPLLEALRGAGAGIDLGAPWPIRVRGAPRAESPIFQLGRGSSSQYASALLLAAAALAARERRPWTIAPPDTLPSAGYLALTVHWLRAGGFEVTSSGARFQVRPPARAARALPEVPADWSSAAYLLLIAWRTGAAVQGLDLEAPHPDRAVLRHLESVGLLVTADPDGLRVSGEARAGLVASAAEAPDLVLALAALACVLPAPSTFQDVSLLRHKESDRLAALRDLARAGGAAVEDGPGDALVIAPGLPPSRRFAFCAKSDHRRVLAASTLGVLLGCGVDVDDPACVAKSFPRFFDALTPAAPAAR